MYVQTVFGRRFVDPIAVEAWKLFSPDAESYIKFGRRSNEWDAIRHYYSMNEELLIQYHQTRNSRPVSNDLTRFFALAHYSPIEENVWEDIRDNMLPLFPQFPIGRYFVDFASPFLMLAIEVDGKAYHSDKAKDDARQRHLESLGYKVVRIPGKDTYEAFEDCYYRLYGNDFGDWDLLTHNDKLEVVEIGMDEHACMFFKYLYLNYNTLYGIPKT